MASCAEPVTLTEAEVQLYDRQIRLWGVEAQQRISQSRVLLVRLHNYHAEIAKNLAAAGFNLTLCDDREYTICPRDSLVIPPSSENEDVDNKSIAEVYLRRLQGMNSFIKVDTINESQLLDYIASGVLNAVAVPYNENPKTIIEIEKLLKGPQRTKSLMGAFTYVGTKGSAIMYCSTHMTTNLIWKQTPSEILQSSTLIAQHKNPSIGGLHAIASALAPSSPSSVQESVALPSFYGAIVGGTITQEIRKFISDEMDKVNYNCVYLSYEDGAMSVCSTATETAAIKKDEPSIAATMIDDVDDD